MRTIHRSVMQHHPRWKLGPRPSRRRQERGRGHQDGIKKRLPWALLMAERRPLLGALMALLVLPYFSMNGGQPTTETLK